MTLEQMQKLAQDALENGWGNVSLPAEAILELRAPPPPERWSFWKWLKGA
jgi:hypothetical protein